MGAVEEVDPPDGIAAIAAYLRMKPGRNPHLMAHRGLPTFTMGSRIVAARKTSLSAWLADREAKARKARAQS